MFARRRLFLSISNERTGATWLSTRLARLPDVAVDCEVAWRPTETPGRGQLVLGGGEDRLADRLEDVRKGRRAVGSTFVFEPSEPFSVDETDELEAAIGPKTRLIHLTRPYFEILKSRESSGALDGTSDGINGSKPSSDAARVGASSGRRPQSAGRRVVLKSPAQLCSELIKYFINDLVAAIIVARAGEKRGITVDVSEICDRFPELATFVGSRARPADVAAVVEAPLADEPEPLDGATLPHAEDIRRFAESLDALLGDVRDDALLMEAMLRNASGPKSVALTAKAASLARIAARPADVAA